MIKRALLSSLSVKYQQNFILEFWLMLATNVKAATSLTLLSVKRHVWYLNIRACQLKISFQRSRVGGNIDQNEPLRLGPMSFGLKLMDRGHFEVLKMH